MLYSKSGPNGDRWSYPNIHGDVMAVADGLGIKQGSTFTYDAFGIPTAVPNNAPGNFDNGWLGSHQRPLEHEGAIATIEMGARPYVPSLGRFLGVDPVEGGSCNDYDYVCGDPVNGFDITGMKQKPLPDKDADCLPGMGASEESLTSGRCSAYRAARLLTGQNCIGTTIRIRQTTLPSGPREVSVHLGSRRQLGSSALAALVEEPARLAAGFGKPMVTNSATALGRRLAPERQAPCKVRLCLPWERRER